MDLRGRSLGGFVVGDAIGAGAWRAHGGGRDVTLYATDAPDAARAAAVEHPALARVVAQGVDDGVTWVAEEAPHGTRLDELGPLPAPRFVPLFESLCDAVTRAHARGVVHGDLRGERVIVTTRGGRLAAKLTGLGASWRAAKPEDDTRALEALLRSGLEGGATLLDAAATAACTTPAQLVAALRAAVGLGEPAAAPRLGEELRARMLAEAPEPLAEAVAALDAARSPADALAAARSAGRTLARLLGAIALAARSRTGPQAESRESVAPLRALRTRSLEDREWLALARDLVAPYADGPERHPLPELVTFLRDHATPLERLLAATDAAAALADLEATLGSAHFLTTHRLIVPHGDRAEVWMGIRRARPLRQDLPSPLPEGWPAILDPDGQPALSLYPLVQAAAPAPGAPEEIFVLAGPGRHGARLESLPYGAVLDDETLWGWFGENLVPLSAQMAAVDVESAPYQGLDPYGPEQAARFFGREREAQTLVNRLLVEPLVVVVGAAGAGKTSLVQAGVVPSLPAGWRALTCRPSLAALAAAAGDPALPLATDPAALGRALRAGGPTLLVVDPAEELFELDEEERRQATVALARAARAAEEPVRVLLVLRDDHLLRLEALPALRGRTARGLHLVATPPPEDVLRALVEPARRAGHDFVDAAAAETMAADAAALPDGLLHLSVAAAAAWEQRDGGWLRPVPVAGALRALVDRALASLSPAERTLVPSLAAALPARTTEPLAARLVDAGLLLRDDGRYRVRHDALLPVLRAAPAPAAAAAPPPPARSTAVLAALLLAALGLGGVLFVAERGAARDAREAGAARAAADDGRRAEAAQLTAALYERGRRSLLAGDPRPALADLRAAAARGASGEALELLTARAAAAAAPERVLVRHQGKVWMVGFSPDGARLVTAADDGARVWDAARGDLLTRLAGHEGTVWSARFSRDGRRLITGGDDRTARVWDAAGAPLATLAGHADAVIDAQLVDAAGERAVTLTAGGEIRVWNVATASATATLRGRALAVSADGQRGAAGDDAGVTRLFELAGGRVVATLTGGDDAVLGVAFAADGRHLCTASADHQLRLWELPSGRLAHAGSHAGEVTGCTFSADGTRVATVSADHTAKVWHVGSGDLLFSLPHRGEVSRARFSPDGARLATASSDGGVRLWDAATGRPRGTLAGHEDSVWWLDFDAGGARLATAALDGTARVWDPARDAQLVVLAGHTDAVSDARFFPDGARLVTASRDHTARVWDAARGVELATLDGHGDSVRSVDVAPDGQTIVTACKDGRVRLFAARGGAPLVTLTPSTTPTAARFAPDGIRVVVTAERGPAELWNVRTGAALARFETPGAADARVSGDGEHVVVAGVDGVARIFELDGTLLQTLPAARLELFGAAFSRDGARVVTASADRTARIFGAARGEPQALLAGHTHEVRGADFSPSGALVVTAGGDATARLWDARSGALLDVLEGHTDWVYAAAFSPDGARVVTSSGDGTARIWWVRRP